MEAVQRQSCHIKRLYKRSCIYIPQGGGVVNSLSSSISQTRTTIYLHHPLFNSALSLSLSVCPLIMDPKRLAVFFSSFTLCTFLFLSFSLSLLRNIHTYINIDNIQISIPKQNEKEKEK